MTDTLIEETVRERIVESIPDALIRTLVSYMEFSQSKPDTEECKEFAERHKAAKVALAHIELLFKLIRLTGLPEDGNRQAVLKALLQEAEADVQSHKSEEA